MVTWLQALVARGSIRPAEPEIPVWCVVKTEAGGWSTIGGSELAPVLRGADAGLGVLSPTYVDRCDLADQLTSVAHLLDRLAEVHQAHPDLPLSLWVGMQWGDGEQDEAARRLRRIGQLAAREPWLRYVGLSLPGPGKLRTTNAAIRLSEPLRLSGWIWVDDDVFMEPGCLSELVAQFLARGGRGAVGATKVAQAKMYQASQWMVRLGRLTAPGRNYPHACCMVVAADVVAGGIPTWLGSDDSHVLFSLLDPSLPDPFDNLRLLPSARCHYYQGGQAGETLRRLQSALYSHLLHSATHPWPVARTYLSQTFFYGLWPIAPWDGRRGPWLGLARWLVKAVHFGWFAGTAATLVVRGLVGRPIMPPRRYPYAGHWSAQSTGGQN